MPELTQEEILAIKTLVLERAGEIQYWVSLCKQKPIRKSGLARAEKAQVTAQLAVKALRKLNA